MTRPRRPRKPRKIDTNVVQRAVLRSVCLQNCLLCMILPGAQPPLEGPGLHLDAGCELSYDLYAAVQCRVGVPHLMRPCGQCRVSSGPRPPRLDATMPLAGATVYPRCEELLFTTTTTTIATNTVLPAKLAPPMRPSADMRFGLEDVVGASQSSLPSTCCEFLGRGEQQKTGY